MSIMDIMKNSNDSNPIVFGEEVPFGKARKSYNFDIYGQMDQDSGKMNGIGRANYKNIIYEGQFKNDKWCGYGRAIFQDGRYHVGFWQNDRKNGPGKTVKKVKKKDEGTGETLGAEDETEVGVWQNDVLVQKLNENGTLVEVEPVSKKDKTSKR